MDEDDRGAKAWIGAGAALVVAGLGFLPWVEAGAGGWWGEPQLTFLEVREAYLSRGAMSQASFLIWGFVPLLALCAVAYAVAGRRLQSQAWVAAAVAGCVVWNRYSLGVIDGPRYGAYAPELGGALVVVGLLVGISQARARGW